jgi:hypothetical protein
MSISEKHHECDVSHKLLVEYCSVEDARRRHGFFLAIDMDSRLSKRVFSQLLVG